MMPHSDLAVVTGAFSYTDRYVTRRLLDQGVRVRTLTRCPEVEGPLRRPGGGGSLGLFPEASGSGLPHPPRDLLGEILECNSLA